MSIQNTLYMGVDCKGMEFVGNKHTGSSTHLCIVVQIIYKKHSYHTQITMSALLLLHCARRHDIVLNREQETQLSIADKPRDAFKGQSRSPNMVPFHMLSVVFYYCATVTLSVICTIFEIFNF